MLIQKLTSRRGVTEVMKKIPSRSSLMLVCLIAFCLGGSSASQAGIVMDRSFGGDGKVVLSGFSYPFKAHNYGVEGLAFASRGSGPTLTTSLGDVVRLSSKGNVVGSYGYESDFSAAVLGSTKDFLIDGRGRAVGIGSWEGRHRARSFMGRLNRRGMPDRSFGGGDGFLNLARKARRDVGYREFAALDVDSEGRYVVGGRGPFGRDFIVKRLLQDGRLDKSFGRRGTWWGKFTGKKGDNYLSDLKVVGDKILVAGHMFNTQSVVFRLTESGRLDRSFGANGRRIGSCGPRGCYEGTCIVQCRSSRLVVAGDGTFLVVHEQSAKAEDQWSHVVFRYRMDGSKVKSFGDNGVVKVDVDLLRPVAPQLVEGIAFWPDTGGVVPLGDGRFVVAFDADVGDNEWRQIGVLFSRSGKPLKASPSGLVFSLPKVRGNWGIYSRGPKRFMVTSRSGDKNALEDELALYAFRVSSPVRK